MTRTAFIGLGNMGGGMAPNLARAGHAVRAFDLSEAALAKAREGDCETFGSIEAAVDGVEAVVTMLPDGAIVHEVYRDHVLGRAPREAILIDCSTIDVATARAVERLAGEAGYRMVDAPVSGGIAAAAAGTLTFMVGGSEGAFALAERLGLDPQVFYDIASISSGQSWSVTSYCPVPGVGPATPADNGYQGGFAAALMLKDLRLALDAAASTGLDPALGRHAKDIYEAFAAAGDGALDFSAVIRTV